MKNNLIKEIKKIKQEVSPRPEWARQSRAILLKEITANARPAALGIFDYSRFISQLFRQYAFEPAVVMLLIFAAFLGGSLTLNAAFYSLPGAPLYRVKIALEKTQLALIPGEKEKMDLKIELAQKRFEELNKIARQTNVNPEEKTQQIKEAVAEFKTNVAAVSTHLNKIKETIKRLEEDKTVNQDKSQAVIMAISASVKTEELIKSIDQTIESLSETEKAEVQEIVSDVAKSAQAAGQSAQELKDQLPASPSLGGPAEGEVKGTATSTDQGVETPAQEAGTTTESTIQD